MCITIASKIKNHEGPHLPGATVSVVGSGIIPGLLQTVPNLKDASNNYMLQNAGHVNKENAGPFNRDRYLTYGPNVSMNSYFYPKPVHSEHKIEQLIRAAATRAHQSGDLPSAAIPAVIEVDEPKNDNHGDLATNFALVMASAQKMAPRKIAESILAHMADTDGILEKTEIAGPGFINFFIRPAAWHPILNTIYHEDERYGSCQYGQGKRVQVEFVSANPTGPLHVGHGRGAAVGDAVGNILAFCGFNVQKEYYINDSGRQIRTLGLSVFLRYRQLCGQMIEFPSECYQGRYIIDMAEQIRAEKGESLLSGAEDEAISLCATTAAGRIPVL